MAGRNMLTTEGHKKLLAEHEELSRKERPKIVQGITDAAAEGDLSENAEYTYGKKRLRELDKRIQYLAGLLKNPVVIDPATVRGDTVQFGATVVIEDEDGKVKEYTIVGEGESDMKVGRISAQAPVARSLLGKKVGESVLIERPAGELEVSIIDLKFAGRAWNE